MYLVYVSDAEMDSHYVCYHNNYESAKYEYDNYYNIHGFPSSDYDYEYDDEGNYADPYMSSALISLNGGVTIADEVIKIKGKYAVLESYVGEETYMRTQEI